MDVLMSAQAARVLRWLPALRRWPKPTNPVGLRARIAILVSSGLLVLIALFVVLGLSALRISTEREIQQKSVLAQMVAAQVDSLLVQSATLGEWAAATLVTPLAASNYREVTSALMS